MQFLGRCQILMLVIVALLAGFQVQSRTDVDALHWETTRLDRGLIQLWFNPAKCQDSRNPNAWFVSCMAGLNEARKLTGHDTVFVPISLDGINWQLSLQKSQPQPTAPQALRATLAAERKQWLTAAPSLIQSMATEFVIRDEILKLQAENQQVSEKYFVGKVMNAQLAVIDAHSYLKPAVQFKSEVNDNGRQEIIGVGILLRQAAQGRYIVEDLIPGSAALAAGIQPEDELLKVGTVQVSEVVDVDHLIQLLRGAAGTQVSLQIKRAGHEQPLTFVLNRVAFEVKNVESRILDEKWGVTKLRVFMSETTCTDVAAALEEQKKAGVIGHILDLRDNSGGILDEAQCILGLFLGPNRPAFHLVAVGTKRPQTHWTQQSLVTDKPLVVLINENSASASELVAATLQDEGRAVLVGERSFGKGSAQDIVGFSEYDPMGTNFAHTTHWFLSSRGRSNQLVGVLPDLSVPYQKGAALGAREILREEDLYPNALPPFLHGLGSELEFASHQKQDFNIKGHCLREFDDSRRLLTTASGKADYQLTQAVAFFECQTVAKPLEVSQK